MLSPIKHSESLTLWDLETELVEAHQRLEELSETGATEHEVNLALQILDAYLTSSVEKRDRCGEFMNHLVNLDIALGFEIDRLRDKQQHLRSNQEHMRTYILSVMDRIGAKKLEGKLFTFSARNNPPAVEIVDELSIAPEFLFQPQPPPPKPDKKAIGAALKRGEEVEGAKLVQKRRLEIS